MEIRVDFNRRFSATIEVETLVGTQIIEFDDIKSWDTNGPWLAITHDGGVYNYIATSRVIRMEISENIPETKE